jgi:hypothetical protein
MSDTPESFPPWTGSDSLPLGKSEPGLIGGVRPAVPQRHQERMSKAEQAMSLPWKVEGAAYAQFFGTQARSVRAAFDEHGMPIYWFYYHFNSYIGYCHKDESTAQWFKPVLKQLHDAFLGRATLQQLPPNL